MICKNKSVGSVQAIIFWRTVGLPAKKLAHPDLLDKKCEKYFVAFLTYLFFYKDNNKSVPEAT